MRMLPAMQFTFDMCAKGRMFHACVKLTTTLTRNSWRELPDQLVVHCFTPKFGVDLRNNVRKVNLWLANP